MRQPECLHIPTLYEGQPAEISWGVMEADETRIVERIFNETFSQALSGQSWQNIDSINDPWLQYEQKSLSWKQFEDLACKGQLWERLDYNNLSWSQIETQMLSWQQIECQDTNYEIFRGVGTDRTSYWTGCSWLELDTLKSTWVDIETPQYTWQDGELVTLPGLSWGDIEARWKTCSEWERMDLTFAEIDTQPDCNYHKGIFDNIPLGAETAKYRIKAYDPEGIESNYLTTDQIPVIPIFYRRGIVSYPVQAGRRYLILLRAREVYGLDQVRMNFKYDSNLLQLKNFSGNSLKTVVHPGKYSDEMLQLYSVEPGKVWFQSIRDMKQDESFSGLITLVELTAKTSGIAKISLS